MAVAQAGSDADRPVPGRCAVHPARPAVDRCPVCGRPRCAADAAGSGSPAAAGSGESAPGAPGCRICQGGRPATAGPRSSDLERLVRGALGALAAAVLGGLVAAQYVDAQLFAYLAPFAVGVGCGAAAQAAAGERVGPTAQRVRAVAAVCAVLSVGLGYLLEGSRAPVSSAALVPALLAVAGALAWTAPPRAARR